MAITQSDFILQELLKQSEKENDNLSAMRELLIEMNKELKKGSKPGGSSGSPGSPRPRPGSNDNKKYSDMFKSMFGSIKGTASTMLGNDSTTANVVGSLGVGVKGVTGALSMLPGPIGVAANAFSMVADAGMAVYEYLNAQLNMYNQLNSSGILLSTGITTLERGAAQSLMSVNEFGSVLTKNSQVIAAMEGQYGSGVESFGKLLNTVQKLQSVNGLYGVSQTQLADLAAKNFKYQKIYSSQEAMRNFNAAVSTETFTTQMVTLSRTVGKSVDELMNKFDNMASNLDSHMNTRSLTRIFGMAEEDATEVNKAFNMLASSLGEPGEMLQKLNASKNSLGVLPEEMNSWFMQMLTDQMQQIQLNKVKDPKQMQQMLSDFMDKNAAALQDEIDAQVMAGNSQQAAMLESLRDNMKLLNNTKQDVSPVLEEFTSRFNTWMSTTFTEPFKTLWADTRDSTLKYLMETYDAADGFFGMPVQMFKDLMNKFGMEWKGFGDFVTSIPGSLLDLIFNDTENIKKSFKDFVDTLIEFPSQLASYIWSLITGDGVKENLDNLKGTVGSVFTHIGDMFSSLADMTFNYDDMKQKITTSFESMKDKLSGWWDSAKSWFSGEDPTDINKDSKGKPVVPPVTGSEKPKEPPKVTEKGPQYTKPVKIEKKDEQAAPVDQAVDPQVAAYESILKLLNSLVSTSEQGNQLDTVNGGYLRQIAENTAGQPNI